MTTLIESLRLLIKQSTETLGAEDPSTLMLQQQLAAALAATQAQRPKVFWIQPSPAKPAAPDKER